MSFSPIDDEHLFQQLASYYFKELDAEEAAKVEQWITANEANAKQYRVVQQLLAHQAETEAIDVDIERGWVALNTKIKTLPTAQVGKVRSMKAYWAAAAVLMGLLVGGWLFFQSTNNAGTEWMAKSGFDTLQLADGSLVIADGSATVKYNEGFNKGNREVQLTGNAFFKVQRDTLQPFTITFNAGKVTVLGTQFTINQQKEGFEVKVREGKVKTTLTNQKGDVILTRGRMGKYDKVAQQFQIQDFAETSMLEYTNESLQTILKDVYLAKGLLIKADVTLASMKLTVDFVQSKPEEILQALELLTQSRIQQTGAKQYRLIQ